MKSARIVLLGLRIVLAGLFVWAAVPKLIDPGEFALAIQNYRLVPDALVGHLAVFVPAFELVIALGLVLGSYQRGAALLATLMLLVFALAMGQARWRGIDLSCGCFGAALEGKVSWLTVARTFGLSVLAAAVLLLAHKLARTEPPPQPATGPQPS
jgi:putative oxidoreductase